MSSKGTSSSVVGSTRFWRIRAPVLLESWLKRTVLGEVALYSFTGTLTSPKLIAPDQIARAISVGLYTAARPAATNASALARSASVRVSGPGLAAAPDSRPPRTRGRPGGAPASAARAATAP